MSITRSATLQLNQQHRNALKTLSALVLVVLVAATTVTFAATDPNPSIDEKGRQATIPLPLQFVPNVGQWPSDLRYWTRAADIDALFMPDYIALHLPTQVGAAPLRLRPLGANAAPDLRAEHLRTTVLHDFRGRDASRWRADIPTYDHLRYVALYAEVDLLFRIQERQLAYDFILHPGADPGQIQIAVEGARELNLEPDGSLRAILASGHHFVQQPPIIYQERDGQREPVSGQFQLISKATTDGAAPTYGFTLGAYDPTRTLIIDPTLEYANFVGGGRDEHIAAVEVLRTGETIVAGTTESTDFAASFTSTLEGPGGSEDGFIYKMNATGTALEFVTLLGGSGSDELNDLALDSSGNLYVAGNTSSNDFPLHNPFFGVLTGRTDAFITKLDADGELIVSSAGFSTYYGGDGETSANAIALDGDDNIYIAGMTTAEDLVLRNPWQATHAGREDGFIAQFSSSGRALEYASYFGGSANDSIDQLIATGTGRFSVSDTGDIVFAGHTTSPAADRDGNQDFPNKHALQAEPAGRQDMFFARFARGGQELVFSTYLGSSNDDVLTDFAIDQDGHYLLAGYTDSDDWPTINAILNYPSGGRENMGIVGKLDRSGRFLHFSTYFGATGDDRVLAIASDDDDNILIGGITESNAFPVQNPYIGYRSGASDGFLAILQPSGQTVSFSTYFGGGDTEEIVAIKSDPSDPTAVIFAGHNENSASLPLFPPVGVSSFLPYAGGRDTFVARFEDLLFDPRPPVLSLDNDLSPMHPESFSAPSPFSIDFELNLQDRPDLSPPLVRGVTAFTSRLFYNPNELDYVGHSWVTALSSSSMLTTIAPVGPGELEISAYWPAGRTPDRIDRVVDSTKVGQQVKLADIEFNLLTVDRNADPPLPSQLLIVDLEELSSASVEGDLDDVISGLPGVRFIERRCNNLIGDCDCSGRVQLFEAQASVDFLLGDPAQAFICVKQNYDRMLNTDLAEIINHYLSGDIEDTSTRRVIRTSDHLATARNQFSDRLDFATAAPLIAPSNIAFNLRLDSTNNPLVISGDIYYNPQQITQLWIDTGAAAAREDKQVSYNIVQPGWLRFVVYGINTNSIPSGVIAKLELEPAPGVGLTDISLDIDASAAISGTETILASNAVALGVVGCSVAAQQHVTEAYIGYYNRCPEPGGMSYWCERLDTEGNGTDLSQIMGNFGTSQEFTDQFAHLPPDQLINNLFINMFGRDADPAGLNYYVNLLADYEEDWEAEHGTSQGATEQALSVIAFDVLNGAQGPDRDQLDNRIGQCSI